MCYYTEFVTSYEIWIIIFKFKKETKNQKNNNQQTGLSLGREKKIFIRKRKKNKEFLCAIIKLLAATNITVALNRFVITRRLCAHNEHNF